MGGDFTLMCVFKQRKTLMEPEENCQPGGGGPSWEEALLQNVLTERGDFPLPLLPNGCIHNKCQHDIVISYVIHNTIY